MYVDGKITFYFFYQLLIFFINLFGMFGYKMAVLLIFLALKNVSIKKGNYDIKYTHYTMVKCSCLMKIVQQIFEVWNCLPRGTLPNILFLVTFVVLTRAKFRAKSTIEQKASLKKKC